MSAQDNAALVRKLYEAFNKQDLDSCLALASEDIEVTLVPFGQTFNGKAGFREFMAGFAQVFPDLTINAFIATEVFEDRAALKRQEALPAVNRVLQLLPDALAAEPEATIYNISSAEPWGD